MQAVFFPHQSDFRKWLQENHTTVTELIVGFYKVDSGKPSLTWSQSVDEALCFGWIDGVRRSIDHESYCIRFTPRKPKSIWSAVNINKIEDLISKGLMQPAGLAAYKKREESNSKIYAYEQASVQFSDDFEIAFQANHKAWDFFKKQAPSYQKLAINWVMSAKQEITQVSRFEKLIKFSEDGKRV